MRTSDSYPAKNGRPIVAWLLAIALLASAFLFWVLPRLMPVQRVQVTFEPQR